MFVRLRRRRPSTLTATVADSMMTSRPEDSGRACRRIRTHTKAVRIACSQHEESRWRPREISAEVRGNRDGVRVSSAFHGQKTLARPTNHGRQLSKQEARSSVIGVARSDFRPRRRCGEGEGQARWGLDGSRIAVAIWTVPHRRWKKLQREFGWRSGQI